MINEALLEMHFHRALIDLFTQTFGVNFLKILKPSQQQECYVGFDQGWVNTSEKPQIFLNSLGQQLKQLDTEDKKLANKADIKTEKFYLGYFFQFKIVETITRRSKFMPEGKDYNVPYYRTELYLSPNPTTQISQHETLLRLCSIPNALVYYACGMLFDISELYENPVDLGKLRFIDVATAPTDWTTNSRHFITFQTRNDVNPFWCSKPEATKSDRVNDLLTNKIRLLSAEEMRDLILEIRKVITTSVSKKALSENEAPIEALFPSSFTIIEFERKIENEPLL